MPQPYGGLVYRWLTEFPSRTPGCLVPLSTVSFELDGGRLWSHVGDWEAVVEAIARRRGTRAATPWVMALPELTLAMLAGGPTTTLHVTGIDGRRSVLGGHDRQDHLDRLKGQLDAMLATGPFWPGDDLVAPPRTPLVMPYQPYSSSAGPTD